MQMIQRVTSDHVPSDGGEGGGGVSIIGVIVTNNIVTSYSDHRLVQSRG